MPANQTCGFPPCEGRASGPCTAKLSNNNAESLCGPAQGAVIVLTPCSGHSEPGVRAQIQGLNCIMSKCRQVQGVCFRREARKVGDAQTLSVFRYATLC